MPHFFYVGSDIWVVVVLVSFSSLDINKASLVCIEGHIISQQIILLVNQFQFSKLSVTVNDKIMDWFLLVGGWSKEVIWFPLKLVTILDEFNTLQNDYLDCVGSIPNKGDYPSHLRECLRLCRFHTLINN